ncbi:mRNA decay activator protein ZFP36L2-like [Varroa jacobsoni]|uniref:mRNA decay activator protein ZFP36L2-like n=1 Tax=Varroa jacobsoni TaxID=62625 RepID=UPI000BF85F00|nr:mRNA decay activator protein ZFP36L2-like [Varroa jacobsoni]
MTVQRYLQIQSAGHQQQTQPSHHQHPQQQQQQQQQQNSNNSSSPGSGNGGTQQSTGTSNGGQMTHHRKLDRSLSEPKNQKGGQNGQNSNSSRYKTELCRSFEESGVCKYGDKCQFAHGYQELRTLTRHPKYKTELCCTFHTKGLCPYGSRCHYIHNPDENRAKIMPQMSTLGQQQQQQSTATSISGYGLQQQQQTHPHQQTPVGLGLQPQSQQQHHRATVQMTSVNVNGPSLNGHAVHGCKPLHASLSSPAIGMAPSHNGSASISNHHQVSHQPASLRSLSLGSSVGSGSSGELSPSSSPGMFEDPFSPSIYGAPSVASRSLSNNPLFSAFGGDLEMSTLAAAFSAAEGHASSHSLLKNAGSAPVTPPFGSQLSLLSSSGPWSSPSSDMFPFPSAGVSLQHSQSLSSTAMQQNSAAGLGLGCGQLFGDSDVTQQSQSSPVNSLTFDFDAVSLGSASSAGSVSSGSLSPGSPILQGRPASRTNHSPLTRLPIFNKLAHSD